MSMKKKNQGEKTEFAKQLIVCLMRDLNMKAGDKLPSQNELRLQFNVGATTIQRAIDTLAKSGILEIRPHKGVFVKNQDTDGFIARQIGLVSMWRTFQPASASMMQCLQLQLHQNACQCKLFMRNFPEMTLTDSLSYFDGLKRCIEQKEIQGLITTVSLDYEAWDFLNKHKIPVVSLDSATFNKGFKVCDSDYLADFFVMAAKRNLKRPALLHCGFPVTDKIRDTFMENCPLDPEIYCCFLQTDIQVEDKPFEWTEKLITVLHGFSIMPANKRPDVLFIPDDIIMNIAHREIVKMQLNGVDWHPHFIYSVSKQIPIIPKGLIAGERFEYDIMKKAETAVKLLLDVICGRKNEAETIYIHPEIQITP